MEEDAVLVMGVAVVIFEAYCNIKEGRVITVVVVGLMDWRENSWKIERELGGSVQRYR